MRAQLEITFSEDSSMLMLLDNAILEEFPNVYSLHADSDVDISINKKDIIKHDCDDDMDEFQIETQGHPITMRMIWEDSEWEQSIE